jgi:hypothetical protein
MLFSRLTHPERINQIVELANDEYLASMLNRSSTYEEMERMVGISDISTNRNDPVPAGGPQK